MDQILHLFLSKPNGAIKPLAPLFPTACVLYLEHEYVVPFHSPPTGLTVATAGKTQRRASLATPAYLAQAIG